jgi:hypothetical protein
MPYAPEGATGIEDEWSKVIYEKLTVPHRFKILSAFYGKEGSFPSSQKLATYLYHEPDE